MLVESIWRRDDRKNSYPQLNLWWCYNFTSDIWSPSASLHSAVMSPCYWNSSLRIESSGLMAIPSIVWTAEHLNGLSRHMPCLCDALYFQRMKNVIIFRVWPMEWGKYNQLLELTEFRVLTPLGAWSKSCFGEHRLCIHGVVLNARCVSGRGLTQYYINTLTH